MLFFKHSFAVCMKIHVRYAQGLNRFTLIVKQVYLSNFDVVLKLLEVGSWEPWLEI